MKNKIFIVLIIFLLFSSIAYAAHNSFNFSMRMGMGGSTTTTISDGSFIFEDTSIITYKDTGGVTFEDL